jgi:hypothetical protein
MGCLYQPELIALLRDLQKYQVVAAFPNDARLRQHFFQLSVGDRIPVLRGGLAAEHHDVRDYAGEEERIVREIYL